MVYTFYLGVRGESHMQFCFLCSFLLQKLAYFHDSVLSTVSSAVFSTVSQNFLWGIFLSKVRYLGTCPQRYCLLVFPPCMTKVIPDDLWRWWITSTFFTLFPHYHYKGELMFPLPQVWLLPFSTKEAKQHSVYNPEPDSNPKHEGFWGRISVLHSPEKMESISSWESIVDGWETMVMN